MAHMGEKRNVYRVLIGKPEGRRRRRRKDNIKIDFEGIWSEVVDWIFWLRRRTGSELLCTRQRTSGFHTMQGIS